MKMSSMEVVNGFWDLLFAWGFPPSVCACAQYRVSRCTVGFLHARQAKGAILKA
jgi:hypothetical protein